VTHRTALIAAGSIAIVVFAAAVAVGANLGILNAADSRPVGKLSAAANAQPSTPVTPAGTTMVAAKTTPIPQKYVIKKIGKVSVVASAAGLRLQDVSAAKGWKWTLAQTSDMRLTVTFTRTSQTYTFLAVLGRHGMIAARVDHPVVKAAPAAPRMTQVTYRPAPQVVRTTAPAPRPTASRTPSSGQYGDGHDGGSTHADD